MILSLTILTKRSIDVRAISIMAIKQFLNNCFNKTLKFKDLNVDMCEEFRVYLNCLVNAGRYSSNTVTAYFNKFLNLIKLAYNENIIPYDYSQKVPKMKWVEPIKEYLRLSRKSANCCQHLIQIRCSNVVLSSLSILASDIQIF